LPLPRSSSLGFSSAAFWMVLSGSQKKWGSGSCPRALPSRSRPHYALERTDDQWAASAWQRFVSHPPEGAPAEACLKREGCLRFGDDTLPAEGGEQLERARVPPRSAYRFSRDTMAAYGLPRQEPGFSIAHVPHSLNSTMRSRLLGRQVAARMVICGLASSRRSRQAFSVI